MSKFAALLTVVAVLTGSSAWAADCTAGARQLRVMSGGQEQRATLVLPASRVSGQRVPLVIGLHPSGGTGQSFDDDTGLVSAATRKGFAVLLPDGAIRTDDGTGYFWNIPGVPLVERRGSAAGDTRRSTFSGRRHRSGSGRPLHRCRAGLCDRVFGRRADVVDGGVPAGRPRRSRCAGSRAARGSRSRQGFFGAGCGRLPAFAGCSRARDPRHRRSDESILRRRRRALGIFRRACGRALGESRTLRERASQ